MRTVAPSFAVLTIVLAVGCRQDPETSALAPGAEVVLAKTAPALGDDIVVGAAQGAGFEGTRFVKVKLGTRATVVRDPGGSRRTRKVHISLKTESVGEVVGTVERGALRPADR
jgi:hypothetical protein